MLAVGTDYEYFNAVWVKNEWSRFLKLIAKGEKKTLIPCYKGIDPYDLPREFAKLQAQDLGKVGSTQDLLRGIDKILSAAKPVQATAQVQTEDLNRSFLYNSALDKMQENTIPALKTAVEKLESIAGWQDSAEKLAQAQKKLKKLKRKKLTKRLIIWGVILAIVGGIAGSILSQMYEEKQENVRRYYNRGESALANYNYADAANYFANAGHYQDAAQQKEQAESWNQAAQAAFDDLLSTYSGKSYYSSYGYFSIDALSMNAGTLRHGGWTSSISVETDSVEPTVEPTMPRASGDNYSHSPLRCAIVYDTASESLKLLTPDGDSYAVSWKSDCMTLSGSGEMDGVIFEGKGNLLMSMAQDLAQYGLYYGATIFCQAAGENADEFASRRLTREEITPLISNDGGWEGWEGEAIPILDMIMGGEENLPDVVTYILDYARNGYDGGAQAIDYLIFEECGVDAGMIDDSLFVN